MSSLFHLLNPHPKKELIATIAKLEHELHDAKVEICRLQSESRHDTLTGLKNRRGFEEDARAILKAREVFPEKKHTRRKIEGEPVSLLFVDADYFKRVNDTHGHDAGDLVLQALADTLKVCVRPDDIVGRWGGEEMVVCLPGMNEAQAAKKAEKIRAAVSALEIVYEKKNIQVTASVGIASTDEAGFNFSELLIAADQALYAAKDGGRNRAIRFSAL